MLASEGLKAAKQRAPGSGRKSAEDGRQTFLRGITAGAHVLDPGMLN
jgi:hypothetical protein